jgi:curved DNA-binding protein CbpA
MINDRAKESFDPYEILGIQFGADQVAIRRAYRQKVRFSHPDSGGSNEAFQNLKKAYDLLSDPDKKRLYDETGEVDEKSIDLADGKIIEILSIAIDKILFKCATEPDQFNINNILELMLSELNEKKVELNIKKTNYEQARNVSQDLLCRFLVSEGKNLMKNVITGRINICQHQIDNINAQLDELDSALLYLKKTEFIMPFSLEYLSEGIKKTHQINKGYHPLLDWGDLIKFK